MESIKNNQLDNKLNDLRDAIDIIDENIVSGISKLINGEEIKEKYNSDTMGLTNDIVYPISRHRNEVINKINEIFDFKKTSQVLSRLIFNRLIKGFKIGEIKAKEEAQANQPKRWDNVLCKISKTAREVGIIENDIIKLYTAYNYMHEISKKIQSTLDSKA